MPGLFDVWLHGVREPHLWPENPVIDITVPGVPDLPYGTPGLPLSIPYALTTQAVLDAVLPNLPPNQQLFDCGYPTMPVGNLLYCSNMGLE